jgi:hypothetical protein
LLWYSRVDEESRIYDAAHRTSCAGHRGELGDLHGGKLLRDCLIVRSDDEAGMCYLTVVLSTPASIQRTKMNNLPVSKHDSVASVPSEARVQRIRIILAAVCLGFGVFFIFWRGAMPAEGLIRWFAQSDSWAEGKVLVSNPTTMRHYYSLSVTAILLIAGALILGDSIWTRLSERSRDAAFSFFFTLAIACAPILYMLHAGYEGNWMSIDRIMDDPSSLPVFGHRLLFVWVAKIFQRITPLSNLRAFYLSQVVAILLAVYALGKWSALHIGKTLSWAGQLLGAVLIATCYDYHNFYDIGTVFFTTCALIAIYKKQYWWLVPIALVGTLNYEGMLLVIVVAAFVAYFDKPFAKWVPPIACALLMYCAVRFVLQTAMPMPRQVDWRLWSNLVKPFYFLHQMATPILALGGWYAIGLMSLRYCDARLKRMLLLFPLLVTVTYLFGQFHEARQFDAFIPVLVAVILTSSKRRFEATSRATSLG